MNIQNQTPQNGADQTENLRRRLLGACYAGAFSGLSPMILDEDRIRNADYDTLVRIARQYGF